MTNKLSNNVKTDKPYPKTLGKQIAFNIELMMSMLHDNRMPAATAALNRALDLCDETHFLETGRDTDAK